MSETNVESTLARPQPITMRPVLPEQANPAHLATLYTSPQHSRVKKNGLSAPRPAQRPAHTPGTADKTPGRFYRTFGKRALDLMLVTLGAPFALLLVGGAALLLWFEGGSPFFRQARLGYGGSVFTIVKLRSMLPDSDHLLEEKLAADPALRAEWDSKQKLENDPRVTRLGAFMRKTSLDELPQLWNVLKGEMSLVGPRPMLPEQLPLYGDATHYHALRPGITGYWQVSERNDSAFQARVAADAAYDRDVSFSIDIKLLWRTIGAVFKRTGY